MKRQTPRVLLACLVVLLSLAAVPGCEDDQNNTSETEKTKQPPEPRVTEWSIKYSGTLEGYYEGQRWELTETGDGDTLLVLRPQKKDDREFSENTKFYVRLPTDKLGQSGEFDVPPGRAGFQLFESGEKDHMCGTTQPTKLQLDTYSRERIRGSYSSGMECPGRKIDVEAEFDIYRDSGKIEKDE